MHNVERLRSKFLWFMILNPLIIRIFDQRAAGPLCPYGAWDQQ
jgi:hypothetical protein